MMDDSKAKKLLQEIKDIYTASQFTDLEKLVPAMSRLRERIKEIENPLVVKTIRLAYEHLEEYKDFLINYVEAEEVGGLNNFEYLLSLWADPMNKYNREDLQVFKEIMLIYPDPLPVPVEEEEEEKNERIE
ncbi:MAG: hypothetical protein ACI959_001608 [Limisphaerales bacterium]|jgi:hypothetical protein